MGLRPLIIAARHGRARSARSTIAAPIAAPRCAAGDKGNARSFQCPYHGWNFLNTGKLRGVPWPDGYACDFKDPKYNVAQVPRVESYRGFIFGTLNLDAPPLRDWLGADQPSRSTNGSTAIPAARSWCARRTG